MINEADIVAEARGWIGTPYMHQASVKGVGCDCLGLLRGCWRALKGQEPVAIPTYTADWSEPQGDEALWRAASQYLERSSSQNLAPGQIILFRMRSGAVAKHLGIVSCASPATFIHAYNGHGVVESPLSEPWQRRIVARFTMT